MSIDAETRNAILAEAQHLIEHRVREAVPGHHINVTLSVTIVTRPPQKQSRAKLCEIFSHQTLGTENDLRLKHRVTQMRNALQECIDDTGTYGFGHSRKWSELTVDQFLKKVSFLKLMRVPKIGRGGIQLLQSVLEEAGFNADVLNPPQT